MKDKRSSNTSTPSVDPHAPTAEPMYHSTHDLLGDWAPHTSGHAKAILEDTMSHSLALSTILADRYGVDQPDLHFTLGLLRDLLDVAFDTLEWWQPREEDEPTA